MNIQESSKNISEKETLNDNDVSSQKRSNSITADHNVMYTPEPLPFIQSMSHGQLVLNPSARDMLSHIEKPLVIISVAGLYRTGKVTTGNVTVTYCAVHYQKIYYHQR